jgi:hypothetical protein
MYEATLDKLFLVDNCHSFAKTCALKGCFEPGLTPRIILIPEAFIGTAVGAVSGFSDMIRTASRN